MSPYSRQGRPIYEFVSGRRDGSKTCDRDLILIESGGDNITTTFSPALADYFIYIIDVTGGDKYPRKRGLGIETCDLLVFNKIDVAPLVGADLSVMEKRRKDSQRR